MIRSLRTSSSLFDFFLFLSSSLLVISQSIFQLLTISRSGMFLSFLFSIGINVYFPVHNDKNYSFS